MNPNYRIYKRMYDRHGTPDEFRDWIRVGFGHVCARCGETFWLSNYHAANTCNWNLNALFNRGDLLENLLKLDQKDLHCAMIWVYEQHPELIMQWLTLGVDLRDGNAVMEDKNAG